MTPEKKTPVAIVTGASSGIGLSLTEHLLANGWRVVMADLSAPNSDILQSSLVLFHQTDISSWESQVSLFQAAITWSGGRISFLAANAGIDDRDSFFTHFEDDLPPKLNMKTVDVDLVGVMYGIRLYMHFARKNKWGTGRIVVTSSMAGIYKFETNPMYAAAKHGLVGLTRSLGEGFRREGVTINAVLPAFVPTGLAPAGLIDAMPKEYLTPMSTMLKAYDELLAGDMSGETVEVSTDQLFWRKQSEYPNESQRWLNEDSKYVWEEMYRRKLESNK